MTTEVGIVTEVSPDMKNILCEITEMEEGMETLVNDEQCENADASTEVTEVGIMKDSKPAKSNMAAGNKFTEVGIVIRWRLVQRVNIVVPNSVTAVGISTDSKLVLLKNISFGSDETVLGIITLTS